MKFCNKCHQTKSFNEFQKDRNKKDGYSTICKSCRKAYKDLPEVKARSKERERTNQIKFTRKQYRLSGRGREIAQESYKRHYDSIYANQVERHNKDPRKRQAKAKVASEVRAGRMSKAKDFNCSYCPNRASDYHHYLGYDLIHWLDVIPVCRTCHVGITLQESS